MTKSIIDRSFNQIVDHIQHSIDTLPKIMEVVDTLKKLVLEIESFVYSPTLEYVSLALKLKRDITEYDREFIVLLSSKQNFKVIIMSGNQLIIKYQKS